MLRRVILFACILLLGVSQQAGAPNLPSELPYYPLAVEDPRMPPFDNIKKLISYYESSSGKYKINGNPNRTIDCGLYHINSSHFVYDKNRDVNRLYNGIFEYYGVGKSLHERVARSILNNRLNEDLARALYEMKGLGQWVSYPKIMKDLKKQSRKEVVQWKPKRKSS